MADSAANPKTVVEKNNEGDKKSVAPPHDDAQKGAIAKLQAEGNGDKSGGKDKGNQDKDKDKGDKDKGAGDQTRSTGGQEGAAGAETNKDKAGSKQASDQTDEPKDDESGYWGPAWLRHMEKEGMDTVRAAIQSMMPGDSSGLLLADLAIEDPALAQNPAQAEARASEVKAAADSGPPKADGQSTGLWGSLSDATSWLADTSVGKLAVAGGSAIKSAVYDPVVDWFSSGDWSGWYDNPQKKDLDADKDKGKDFFSYVMDENNFQKRNGENGAVEQRAARKEKEFNERTDVANAAPLTDAQGGKIELPKDAKDTGEKVKMGGQELHIHRDASGKQTYLVNDKGEVVARSKPDGSYEMMMRGKDGKPDGKMDVKIEKNEKTGEWEVKHLERYDKSGHLINKMENGALLNYVYDHSGKLVGVDGMLDLRDQNLTPQQLQERIKELQKEIGPNGQALVRARNEKGESVRLHLMNLGQDTQVITDMDQRRAEVHNGGVVYRINEHGDIGTVGPDGKWHELSDQQRAVLARQAELMSKIRLAQRFAEGDQTALLENIRHRINADGGDDFERIDPRSLQPLSTLHMPKKGDESKPMSQEDHVRHEQSTVAPGGKVDVRRDDGTPIWNFDPKVGLRTPEFTVTDRLTDRQTGYSMDSGGNVYDASGRSVFNAGSWDAANPSGGSGSLTAEQVQALIVEAQAKASTASSYASQVYSLMFTPGSLDLCKGICLDALGVLGSVDSSVAGVNMVTVAARGDVYDALSAVSVGQQTYVQLAGAGLNDSALDTGNLIREAALSVNTSPVAVLNDYREQRREASA